MMLLSPRLWLALAIAAALAFTHTMAYRSGGDSVQVAWDKATATRTTQDRDTERENAARASRQQTTVIEAINAQTHRTHTLTAAAAAARTESDGLRSDLAAIRAVLPTTPNDARSIAATATSELLDQCARAYQELAATADGHASDTLTLQSSWPK